MAKPWWTTAQIVNQLTTGPTAGAPWTMSDLTFSFPTVASPDQAGVPNIGTFTPFTATQAAAARLALASFSDVADITLTEVSGPGGNAGDLRFHTLANVQGGEASASHPGPGSGGDLYFGAAYNTEPHNMMNPIRGHHGFLTYLHEIAHAMGIGHAGNYNGGNPSYAADALFAQDTEQYTVMSYFQRQDANNGSDHTYYENTGQPHLDQQFAETLMLYDIAAMHAMYGANPNTRATATTYGFHSNTGSTSPYNFANNIDPVICIYDAGGKDTLDFSGFTEKTRLDLNQGAFSNTARMAQNVSIAFGTIIENGIGGSAGDVIRGNSVSNRLEGLGGSDGINGYAGADTILGGSGNDVLSGGLGKDVLRGDAGRDTYVFNTALGVANVDTIKDFVAADDTIRLDDAIFTKLGSWNATKFHASVSGKAHDASDRIVYETDTGKLFYDADGNKAGGAVGIQFAVLTGHPTLTHADFVVV
jgi:serralysin